MLISLFFIILFFACLQGLNNNSKVAGLILVVGFSQDPIRKLIAGEPVLMTAMVGLVIACVALRCALDSQQSIFEPFVKWPSHINVPLGIYLLIVFVQAAHSIIRYKSPVLTGLGAIFYLAPLVSIVVGYTVFKHFRQIRQFLFLFSCLAIVVALSIFLSFFGVQSDLLGEVGSGLVIYDQGTILRAYSGLMRSSEIASWHMGACICFLVILLIDRASMSSTVLVGLAVALLFAAIILTGRRKMIVQIAIFGSLYFPILRYYQARMSTRFVLVILIGAALLSTAYLFIPSLEGTQYDLYLARGATVFNDAGERFSTLGIGSVGWAYNTFGFFGGGLGVAAQGAQHFVTVSISGAAEGGLGKLASELGVFSLFFIVWLSWAFAMHIHKCVGLVALAAPSRLPLIVGCLAFLFANIPTFIVASQVFGDVFVLTVLGTLAGGLFSLPKLVITDIENAKANNLVAA